MADVSADTKNWMMIAHISGAAGQFFMPSFGFIAPLVVMAIRSEDPVTAWHAKQAAMFQGAMSLIAWLIAVVATGLSCFFIGMLIYPFMLVPIAAAIIVPLIGAMKVNNGEEFEYPLIGSLLDKPPEIG